ncbi:MAG: YbaK/EbsC family protein, partial [Thermomicrobium sp.]|nr:YbaK/EbsC family protein [Thermomicrobium sp.]
FCSPEGRCVIAVIRGDQRVDPVLLAAATGQRSLALAPAEQVETVTGYPAGATPPVGHRHQVPVIVDPAVLEEREVYGGGGTRDTMLRIEPAELVRLASAMVAPIARPA